MKFLIKNWERRFYCIIRSQKLIFKQKKNKQTKSQKEEVSNKKFFFAFLAPLNKLLSKMKALKFVLLLRSFYPSFFWNLLF
jgi:hypothetical protein